MHSSVVPLSNDHRDGGSSTNTVRFSMWDSHSQSPTLPAPASSIRYSLGGNCRSHGFVGTTAPLPPKAELSTSDRCHPFGVGTRSRWSTLKCRTAARLSGFDRKLRLFPRPPLIDVFVRSRVPTESHRHVSYEWKGR